MFNTSYPCYKPDDIIIIISNSEKRLKRALLKKEENVKQQKFWEAAMCRKREKELKEWILELKEYMFVHHRNYNYDY